MLRVRHWQRSTGSFRGMAFKVTYSFANCRIKLTWSTKNKLLNYDTRYTDVTQLYPTHKFRQIRIISAHQKLSLMASWIYEYYTFAGARVFSMGLSSFDRLLDQLKYRLTHCIRAGCYYCGETGE
jgi:hypothetical protein